MTPERKEGPPPKRGAVALVGLVLLLAACSVEQPAVVPMPTPTKPDLTSVTSVARLAHEGASAYVRTRRVL